MGTSSDFKGSSGGAWTPYKRAVTDYAKFGGSERINRVLARHVATLGGAGAAAAGATIGGAQRLSGVLAGIASEGLAPTLERLGLGHLVGRDRFEVLEALLEVIAGPGGDLDAEAARHAACDVIEVLFEGAQSFDELEDIGITDVELIDLLETFVGLCVFYKIVPLLAERLAKYSSASAATSLEREMKEFIRGLVRLKLSDRDPLAIDWDGLEGQQIIEEVVQGTYQHMEALE